MTLTRTASASAQALAMELGITDTAKKAKVFDHILALLTLERERCTEKAAFWLKKYADREEREE